MKKLYFIILLVIGLKSQSQDYGSFSLRGGMTYFNENILIGPGGSFQFEVFKKFTAGIHVDLHEGSQNMNIVIIQPRLDYYIQSVFSGLHVGGNFAVNFAGDSKLYYGDKSSFNPTFAGSYGINAGYSIPISNLLYADFSCDGGLIKPSHIPSYLIIKPVLSIGIKFR